MTLVLKFFETAEAFAERAMTFLLEHEAEHCLLIGIVAQAIENVQRWGGPNTFASVEQDEVPVAFAVRPPPFQPVPSRVEVAAAIPYLVEHFLQQRISGVMAPIEIGALIASVWSGCTCQGASFSMPERIYKVETVKQPIGVPGMLRTATDDDLELLIRWNQAFVADAFGEWSISVQAELAVDFPLYQ